MSLQVNLYAQVNSKNIRKVTHNGREHWVLPSYTLPSNVVMNGILYTQEEIDKHYKGLEGTLAPLGHPQVNGQFISAFEAEAINVNHVGAWNRNVKKAGNRIYLEKWIDIEIAKKHERGPELLERIEAIVNGDDVPPIHTSVAAFLDRMEANEEQKKRGIDHVAKIATMDHDAILLDEVGAATPEQGVGLMVNTADATPISVNADALIGESYREREARIDRAAKEHFGGEDRWVTVLDFTDDQAVIMSGDSGPTVYGYAESNGQITFDPQGIPVARQESWVTVVANKIKKVFNPQARPVTKEKEDDMSLTKEEKAEIAKEIGETLSANLSDALDKAIGPVTERLAALEANQKEITDNLTANSRAKEEVMRKAVAAKFGETVANSLSGDALAEMHKQCGKAAPIGNSSARGNDGDDQQFDQVPD